VDVARRTGGEAFFDALSCLAADGLTKSQFDLIRRAAASAVVRNSACPFCKGESTVLAARASEASCRWCLRA
jgi:hypothetical protein